MLIRTESERRGGKFNALTLFGEARIYGRARLILHRSRHTRGESQPQVLLSFVQDGSERKSKKAARLPVRRMHTARDLQRSSSFHGFPSNHLSNCRYKGDLVTASLDGGFVPSGSIWLINWRASGTSQAGTERQFLLFSFDMSAMLLLLVSGILQIAMGFNINAVLNTGKSFVGLLPTEDYPIVSNSKFPHPQPTQHQFQPERLRDSLWLRPGKPP